MESIVLTGGPCAGKSTSLSFLQMKLMERGLNPIMVPEAASMLIGAGISPIGLEGKAMFNFQENLIKTQLYLEDTFKRLAQAQPKTVLICDRGCMDNKAYMPSEMFKELLKKNGWQETDLCDQRYLGVFHMVTAAQGAEEFYTLENNKSRKEKKDSARELDAKTQAAWIGHPHLRIIPSEPDFEAKKRNLLRLVERSLGVPESLEIERKFLLQKPWFPETDLPVPYQTIMIEQCYLKKEVEGVSRRIRRRWRKNSGSVFYLTTKESTKDDRIKIEVERHISDKTYLSLLPEADPKREIIVKKRICFLWKYQYFELDVFLKPERLAGLSVLEIELTDRNDVISIPDFLKVDREVTEDKRYSNSSLAKLDNQIRRR